MLMLTRSLATTIHAKRGMTLVKERASISTIVTNRYVDFDSKGNLIVA